MKHQSIRNRIADLDGRQMAALDDIIVRAADDLADEVARVFETRDTTGEITNGLTALEMLELKAEIIDALRRRFAEVDAGVAPAPSGPSRSRANCTSAWQAPADVEREMRERTAVTREQAELPPGVRSFDLIRYMDGV